MPPREANNLEFLGGQRERADLLQGSNPHVSAGWSSLVTRIHLSHQPPLTPPASTTTLLGPQVLEAWLLHLCQWGYPEEDRVNYCLVGNSICFQFLVKTPKSRVQWVFGWKHTVSERLLLGGAPSPTAGFSPSISQWSNVQNKRLQDLSTHVEDSLTN